MILWLKSFRRDRRGATAIEYAFLAALIAMAVVAGVSGIGSNLAAKFAAIPALFG